MHYRRQICFFLFPLVFGPILACAPVISPSLRAKVDPALTFKEVFQNPNGHRGKIVLWGGEISQILPQNGTALIEVQQMALGWRGKPEGGLPSEGKFLMKSREPLDLYLFKRREKITVAGEIQGTFENSPLVIGEEVHFWKEYRSSPPYGLQGYGPSFNPRGTGGLRY